MRLKGYKDWFISEDTDSWYRYKMGIGYIALSAQRNYLPTVSFNSGLVWMADYFDDYCDTRNGKKQMSSLKSAKLFVDQFLERMSKLEAFI